MRPSRPAVLALRRLLLAAGLLAFPAAGAAAQTATVLPAMGTVAAGAPDLDGDGRGDILVGDRTNARALSGETGAVLHTLASPNAQSGGLFSAAVAGVPDATGDGRGDLLVGAPAETVGGTTRAGRAYLFSGATGLLVRTLVGPLAQTDATFGASVAGVPDANGDGRGDLLVGMPGAAPGGTSNGQPGRAYLFSGADGTLLRSLASPQSGPFFGSTVSAVPDADGDGRGDVLVLSSAESLNGLTGAAFLYSGATGAQLHTFQTPSGSISVRGQGVAGVPDVDGDGRGDVLVGASTAVAGGVAAGRVLLFSGATGTLLRTLDSPAPVQNGAFGVAVVGVPDADGDGRGDVGVGATGETAGGEPGAGNVYLFSGRTGVLLRLLRGPVSAVGLNAFGRALAAVPDRNGRSDVAFYGGDQFQADGSTFFSRFVHVRNSLRPVVLAGAQGWRLLAAPVQTAPAQLFGPTWTQGAIGADDTDGGPNVYRYDETAAGARAAGFAPVNDLLLPAVPGRGYAAYLFADDDATTPGVQGGFPKNLFAQGLGYTGLPTAFPVSYTNAGSAPDDGWNLLGNPYERALDWDAPGWTKTKVSNTVYVYDPVGNVYRTWNGSAGSLGDGVVAEFQGFWVKATDVGPALVAPFSATTTTTPTQAPRGAAPAALGIEIAGLLAGQPARDAAFASFTDGAADGLDPFDGYELAPFTDTFVSLHAVAGETRLDIDARAPLTGEATFSLDAAAFAAGAPAGGAFTLTWPDVSALPAAWTVTLTDTETGDAIDLRAQSSYAFTLAATASRVGVPAARTGPSAPTPLRGAGGARFAITLRGTAVAADAPAGTLAFALDPPRPNPAAAGVALGFSLAEAGVARLTVFDALGRRVAVVAEGVREAGRHAVPFDAARLPAGLYVVRLEAGGTQAVRMLTVAH